MAFDQSRLDPPLPRSIGATRFARAGGRIQRLDQQGCMKILLPRGGSEAVIVNTAGGVTGGDRLQAGIDAGAPEALTVTTQAAERIYRSAGGFGQVLNELTIEAGARIDWLPQETILFDGAALERRLTVRMAGDATLLALESLVFGRAAHGETVRQLHLRDHWRIWRDGRLTHAEAVRMGDMPTSSATLQGARATATLIFAAPGAETARDTAHSLIPDGAEAAVTALPGMVLARLMAPSAQVLRAAIIPLIRHFRAGPPPRVWQL